MTEQERFVAWARLINFGAYEVRFRVGSYVAKYVSQKKSTTTAHIISVNGKHCTLDLTDERGTVVEITESLELAVFRARQHVGLSLRMGKLTRGHK